MRFRVFLGLGTTVATLALAGLANPAQAISFTATNGISGPNGETNLGAYSDFSKDDGFVTVDFNNGSMPTSGFAQYSFVGGNGSNARVIADKWAPTGTDNEVNNSSYLTAFKGTDVVINLDTTLNYFGIDWGSAHDGNTFSFFNGGDLVQSFVYYDNENKALGDKTTNVKSALASLGNVGSLSNQYNGYFHFYSEGNADVFDKIVISQVGGGGFETDNHSFHAGTSGFDFESGESESVPEPGIALGMLVIGGVLVGKRYLKTAQA